VFLIVSWAMGAGFFWDIRGFATHMRARVEAQPITGRLNRLLPSWFYRAFGVWCFVFGTGVFVFLWSQARR